MKCSGSSPVDQRVSQIRGKFWYIGNIDFIICFIYLFGGFKSDFLIKMFCRVISSGLDYLRAQGHCVPFFIHLNIQNAFIYLLLCGRLFESIECV